MRDGRREEASLVIYYAFGRKVQVVLRREFRHPPNLHSPWMATWISPIHAEYRGSSLNVGSDAPIAVDRPGRLPRKSSPPWSPKWNRPGTFSMETAAENIVAEFVKGLSFGIAGGR